MGPTPDAGCSLALNREPISLGQTSEEFGYQASMLPPKPHSRFRSQREKDAGKRMYVKGRCIYYGMPMRA